MPNFGLRRRAGLKARWCRLSAAKQHALEQLEGFAVPMHQTALKNRNVRPATLYSLQLYSLARRIWLFEEGSTIPMPFWLLTQEGEAMLRASDVRG